MGIADWDMKARCLILNVFNLSCLSDIQLKMLSRKLNIEIYGNSGRGLS